MTASFGTDIPISLLRGTKLPIVTVSESENVRSALTKMAQANVLSAPFIQGGKAVSFIDMTDIVSFLVHLLYRKGNVEGDKGRASLDAFAHVVVSAKELDPSGALAKAFFETPVSELPNHSGRNSWKPFPPSANLAQILTALNAGASRVPILDESGQVVNIISQSTVTHFLADAARQNSHPKITALCNKTLAQLDFYAKPVVHCEPNARVVDVFASLHEHHVSALALLDHNDHVLGNISVKDVRALLDDFHRLALPVHEYVNIIRRENLKAVYPSITVRPGDTFGHIVAKLSVCGIHRLYVTDTSEATSHVIGIVSVRDVVQQLVKALCD